MADVPEVEVELPQVRARHQEAVLPGGSRGLVQFHDLTQRDPHA